MLVDTGGSTIALDLFTGRREAKAMGNSQPCDGRNRARRSPSVSRFGRLVLLQWAILASCVGAGSELELTSQDQSHDQAWIASVYQREAARLWQSSQQMSARLTVYERVFGAESDWVTGTRVLAQALEEEALEHERKARQHLKLLKQQVGDR